LTAKFFYQDSIGQIANGMNSKIKNNAIFMLLQKRCKNGFAEKIEKEVWD